MFKRIQDYFKPQDGWALSEAIQFKRQRQVHALWIGIVAFLMPALLFYSNISGVCFRDTISHTYYTPVWGDVFVALTSFVGLFLFFYRGQSLPERVLAVCAGISAIVVAVIPTTGSGCELSYAPSRIFVFNDTDRALFDAFTPNTSFEFIHGVAAAILFSILTVFSVFVFTAVDTARPTRNKHIRNVIYRITGGIMLATLGLLAANAFIGFPDCDIFNVKLGIGQPELVCTENTYFTSTLWDDLNLTFYFEWAALAAFGVAWIVKGRGGGFLLLDEAPNQIFAKPWWMGPKG